MRPSTLTLVLLIAMTGIAMLAWREVRLEAPGGRSSVNFAGGVTTPDTSARAAPDIKATPGDLPSRRIALELGRTSLSGDVVDVDGRPISGARITCYGSIVAISGSHGEFVLPRPANSRSAFVQLWCNCDGFDRLEPRDWYTWGRGDVRLVMQRRVPLAVRVCDRDGHSVEARGVSIQAPVDGESIAPLVWNGECWLGTCEHGRNVVRVELEGQDFWPPLPTRIEVTGSGIQQVVVEVHRAAQRTVVVAPTPGSGVAGSAVKLIDPGGHEVQWSTYTSWWEVGPDVDTPVCLAHATTDATGAVVLHGPAGVPLTVVALGPGHQPIVVERVDLGVREPLVVEPRIGAEVQGRLVPQQVVEELFERGSWNLVLIHPDSAPVEEWSTPIGRDGTFQVRGAPPGHWDLLLEQTTEGCREGGLPALDLVEGVNAQAILDIASWRVAELRGRVLVDGSPFHERLWVVGDVGVFAGEPDIVAMPITSDADGRFKVRVRPGRYGVQRERPFSWHRAAELELHSGEIVEHEFRLQTGVLDIALDDELGRPAGGCVLTLLYRSDDAVGWETDPTNADGLICERVEAREWHVALVTTPGDSVASGKDGAAPERSRPHLLGTVSVHAGETTHAGFKVPLSVLAR